MNMSAALVMQVKLGDGLNEDARKMLEGVVVPLARSQAGFQKGTWMHDGDNGMGVIVFDTAEHAVAAKEPLKPMGDVTLVSVTVYDVAAEA
jgi:hypothetical protein